MLSYRSIFLQVYISKFIRVVFLPFGANFSCLLFFFLVPSGLRSRVRFARCPAATCSSRAAASVTGRVHDKTVWLMAGRGGHCKKKKKERKKTKQLEVERAVPRRCGLLAFCAVTSACCYPEDSSDASQARGHRGQNEGDLITWCIITLYEL